MKFFKTLFLLSISTLAINAWAHAVALHMVESGTTLEDGTTYKGAVYDDGTAVLPGEKVKVIFAIVTKSADAEDLFDVDRDGNISLKSLETPIIASEDDYEVLSYEVNEVGTFGGSTTIKGFYEGKTWVKIVSSDAKFDSAKSMAFLVRCDSRYYDANTDTYVIGDKVNSWGAETLAKFNFSTASGPAMGGSRDFVLDFDCIGFYKKNNPVPVTKTPFTLPTSIVVEGETYVGDELKSHLTPSMSAVVANTTNDGFELTCGLDEGFRDVLTYTLQTKASLSEDWVNFDTIAETLLADINENLDDDSKKSLANNLEKRYTYLRVKESTQIKIPKLPGETQRFYRLIAE